MSVLQAGTSTCPICSTTWTVTPVNDCLRVFRTGLFRVQFSPRAWVAVF